MQIWKSGVWNLDSRDSRFQISRFAGLMFPDSGFPDLQDLCFRIPGFQIPDFQKSGIWKHRSCKSGIWKRRSCKSGNLESGNLGPTNLEFGTSGSLGRANLEIWNLETYVLQRAGNQEIQTLETSRRRSSGGGRGANIYFCVCSSLSFLCVGLCRSISVNSNLQL